MALNTGNPFLDALGGSAWVRTAANTTPYTNTLVISVYFDNDTSEGHSTGGAWTAAEKASFWEAMSVWSKVANISFLEVDRASAATLIERKVTAEELRRLGHDDDTLGAHDTPGNPTHIGYYNTEVNWTSADMQPGGLTFETFVHELGHALGLAHPHDTHDGTGLFPGIEVINETDGSGDSNDFGDNQLNNTLYTTMSYLTVPGTDPDELTDRGYTASPMAFDIATIQLMYGAVGGNYGDTVYMLRDDAPGNAYTCIWDTDGVDTIRYDGSGNTTIDLRAATLRNEPGGGGFLSRVSGVNGGFTIAADITDHDDNGNLGVIIENAVGGFGRDALIGNDVSNRLEGRDGADFLDGGGGLDSLIGGDGDDTYDLTDISPIFFGGLLVGASYDTVVEAADEGIDTVRVTAVTGGLFDHKSYTLGTNIENGTVMGSGAFNLKGNALDNVLTGNGASNTLDGRDGDDTLDGGGGRDLLIGGAGDDTYILHDVTATVVGSFVIGEAYDTVVEGEGGGIDWIKVGFAGAGIQGEYTLGDHIEHGAVIGDESFDLTGNALGNWLVGNDAGNTLVGLDGNDSINGLGGFDILIGGTGDDTYYLRDVTATFFGGFMVGEQYDAVHEAADEGSDWIVVSSGVGIGFDGDFTLTDNVENGRVEGIDTFDLAGNELDNMLVGNDADNTLSGFGGNDTLIGAFGLDTLIGGAGDDTYLLLDVAPLSLGGMWLGETWDTIVEGADEGIDTVMVGPTAGVLFDHSRYTLADNLENGRILGEGAFDLTGNGIDNELYGNDQANKLLGLAGNDQLFGGGGDDILDGGTDDDVIAGGAGADTYYVDSAGDLVIEDDGLDNDVIYASVSHTLADNVETLILQGNASNGGGNGEANSLYGNARNNVLSGFAGDDQLFGGAGRDQLRGGADNDRLDGGAGMDTLTGGAGMDTFVFLSGQANGDVIVDFAGKGAAAGDTLQFVGFGTAAQGATFTKVAGTNQWQIQSGLDGHIELITLSNNAAMHATDYMFA